MMLVRRDSWLLGGQLPLCFILCYSLFPTLSLVLYLPAAASPSPALGARSHPAQGRGLSLQRAICHPDQQHV